MRVPKRETYWLVQTFENDLTLFSPFQAQREKRHVYKTYLPSVYPAAILPYSDDRQGNMHPKKKKEKKKKKKNEGKGSECGDRTYANRQRSFVLPADKV